MKARFENLGDWLFTLLGGLLVLLIAPPVAGAAQVKGTAAYRERIALTPDAVFEAMLEDVSKADAPAVVVGSVRIDKPGQVPIRFEIPFDPARIDQSRSYSVRARIMVGQQLLFTTDQAYPVLTRGHDNEVQIMLRMVTASKPASKPAQAAPLGTLPASFIGELPCADCPGIRYHVNLFPDRVFFLRTTHIGRADNANFDDIGSWVISSDRATLILKGGREAPEIFAIKDRDTLRKLDIEGHEITSPLNYDLQRTKNVEPLEPRLTMRGMYRYFADAGLFTECLTRRRWPVAQEKDNAALESAYTKGRLTTGEELLVNLEGQIAMRPKMEGQRCSTDLGGRALYRRLAGRDMRRAFFLGSAGKHLLEVDPSERQARKRGSQTARTTLRARQQNEANRRLRGLQPVHRYLSTERQPAYIWENGHDVHGVPGGNGDRAGFRHGTGTGEVMEDFRKPPRTIRR